MLHKRLSFLVFLCVLGESGVVVAGRQQTTVGDIKNSLVCLCDCSMTVEACQGSMACESADKLTMEAEQYIQQGMNKEAVLAAFITKYGEHILAAPTKRGFNLMAWILPFAAIIVAGFGITVVIRRWVRKSRKQQSNLNSKARKSNGEKSPYEERLEEVLRHLD